MNIENIEAFVYVIHYGSFNKAGEALYLSQPSVTARIQSLERELDCRLFDRLGKQIQLTDEGKRFLPYAQQVLQTYRKGKLHVQQKNNVAHELRLGSTISVANYTIPELLPRLKANRPEVAFRLMTGTSDEILQRLLGKEIDLGFVRNIVHPNIQSVKFFDDPIRLYVYEGHPFLEQERVTIDALSHQSLIFFECGSLDWQRVHRAFESLDRPPNIAFQVDNSETAKKMVLNKAGICFLPGRSVFREVQARQLFPIELPEIAGIALQTNVIALKGEHDALLQEVLGLGSELVF